ncbi:CATRA system-associated protein [Streptomyces prunicolor]|uniref:CATRA system-associated protein n=1 Tax=Streptomyces prunicolor TaxID=67348 RepID=UPI003715ACF3
MQSRADSPGTGMEAALLARVRELLDDLPKWRLPHAAWSRPAAAVEALAAAYDAGDGLALQVAVARLEVLSPPRPSATDAPDSALRDGGGDHGGGNGAGA